MAKQRRFSVPCGRCNATGEIPGMFGSVPAPEICPRCEGKKKEFLIAENLDAYKLIVQAHIARAKESLAKWEDHLHSLEAHKGFGDTEADSVRVSITEAVENVVKTDREELEYFSAELDRLNKARPF